MWRRATWWHNLQTRMMEEDPDNRTRWKHKWRWHKRGNVWDKIATRWAGKENWIVGRKKKRRQRRSTKFVAFVLSKKKLPTENRKSKSKDTEKKIKDKTPRDLVPEDIRVRHWRNLVRQAFPLHLLEQVPKTSLLEPTCFGASLESAARPLLLGAQGFLIDATDSKCTMQEREQSRHSSEVKQTKCISFSYNWYRTRTNCRNTCPTVLLSSLYTS